ncbi:hypothetical protein FOA43_002193 [Brettanomyces nanus]|uniref:Diphthine--ammonia ligase n=1 Tax=Eeniella nana TaxID=13502 RepID=A0A875RUR1_EENNA|nr:uncharacterized protein FOA43_002193 [Brettanomyces nanus]QPG74857.1 hypothetical protein FOA43_002193 [Brettanomyces nanus]
MKFVALVSGGKDSCFNILHCLANGHELICLANLYPPPSGSDEIDSFMYQTVGYDALKYYAECIGKPLYSQMIRGTAENKELEYARTSNDEIEDLYSLLTNVLKEHPDVEAVSVGAILSNYQRTRVEDVCNRLGLTSLSYLWQRDQAELMSEMCQSGLDAILIKVAAIGLSDNNLGMTLQQAFPVLSSLNSRFGVHICGEGGEFETLVLDAPFFRCGKLVITEQKVLRHTNDDVWYMKLKVEVEKKVPPLPEKQDWSKYLHEPSLLTEEFQEIEDSVNSVDSVDSVSPVDSLGVLGSWKTNTSHIGNKIYICNLSSYKPSVSDQITDIFTQLKGHLDQYNVSFSNIQSVDIFLSDMKDFAQINGIYKSYFTKPLPPARCCVETNLPTKVKALVSLKVLPELTFKEGLHVQSRSYWAPSNIGPYSQTIIDRNEGIAHLSGQIPLIPKTMQLCTTPVKLSATLALQHLDRVKNVVNYPKSLLLVAYITDECWLQTIVQVHNAYTTNDKFIIVQVTDLPKGAPVEWSGLSYKDPEPDLDEESDTEIKDPQKSVTVFFTDSLEELSTTDKNSHYTIYCKPADLMTDLGNLSYEFCPVCKVYRGDQSEFKYGIVKEEGVM